MKNLKTNFNAHATRTSREIRANLQLLYLFMHEKFVRIYNYCIYLCTRNSCNKIFYFDDIETQALQYRSFYVAITLYRFILRLSSITLVHYFRHERELNGTTDVPLTTCSWIAVSQNNGLVMPFIYFHYIIQQNIYLIL